MKALTIGFCFVLWMIFTLLLTVSLVGMFLFIPDTYEPSSWMKIGIELLNSLTK